MASSDTQWPRFQVFLQEKEGAAHQDVGSVHAPDPELALLNARDVFVRRPDCVSLWVVPADLIFARTAQEIAAGALHEAKKSGKPGSNPETYCIFSKKKSAGTQTFVGEVEARGPVEAMEQALAKFAGAKPPFAWLVFPQRLIVSSTPEDIESMFAPAYEKPFRLATDFHTLTEMRKIMAKQKEEDT